MTTIVTDGKRIAADSQTSYGDERTPDSYNKVVIDGSRLFAYSGPVNLFKPLIDWYIGGCLLADIPKIPDDHHHHLFVFDHDIEEPAWYANVQRCPYPDSLSFPAAIGSGRKYALGAIEAGASLEEAVRVASKWDVYTGGEIKVWDIPKS